MAQETTLTRRNVLGGGIALLSGILASRTVAAQVGAVCSATPAQTEGPFYPVTQQPDKDNDLTVIPGATAAPLGQVVYILGRVIDEQCKPVPQAGVEIWQACASGKYKHPNDPNPAPLDPNFQYWGRAVTDAQGKYAFKTIIPGAYPADTGWIRPPHIHFKVYKRSFHELTTQMYFAGNPYNAKDKILLGLKPEERAKVIVTLHDGARYNRAGAQLGVFNLSIKKVL